MIGYHSPKFENEKIDANVLKAIKRYDITHPVVCGDGKLWDQLGIICWPTVVITSPNGLVLFNLIGENVVNESLLLLTQATIQFFSSGRCPDTQTVEAEKSNEVPTDNLSFPGKIKASLDESLIAISDSGSNRIIICNTQGSALYAIGGPKKGYVDGNFSTSLFSSPQGVAWSSDSSKAYVADTGNDVVRAIDLTSKMVESITLQIEMSSPWDIVLVDDDKLFVAMAGCHQIWLLALETVNIGNRIWEKFSFKLFAGNGKEENRNNSYPLKAGFAQPSGLAYSEGERLLFVADSESSSIRSISVKDGAVKNIVGGSIDPLDLFCFGDQDGKGQNARLQHPMAVSFNSTKNLVIVADTYNHKVRFTHYLTTFLS